MSNKYDSRASRPEFDRRTALALAAALGSLVLPSRQAFADEQQRLVDEARISVDGFYDGDDVARIRAYVKNAYGVLLIPELLTAGFIIGAEYGVGLLLVRDIHSGDWSVPAFYDVIGGSLGIQLGGKSSDALITIMNSEAIDKILSSKVTLGADASLAIGGRGVGIGAATTMRFGEDIYVFAREKGLFGGLALDGSLVLAKDDWNEAYYGQSMTPETIIRGPQTDHPGTSELRGSLAAF